MDKIQNPFLLEAGTLPSELAGRQHILDKAHILFERLKAGCSEKSSLLIGFRGVGKSALLNEIKHLSEKSGCKSILIEAHEGKALPKLLFPPIRQLLFQLDRMENLSIKVKRSFQVLKSFMNAIKMKFHDFEISWDIDSEIGTAASGYLESGLRALFEAIAEAAMDRKIAIAIIIGELQSLTELEMSALIMAVHKVAQKNCL